MRVVVLCCILLAAGLAGVQGQVSSFSRGSIPEELLRPRRGEAPRYPIDAIIGQLGQGRASAEAFSFAVSVSRGLLSGNIEHPSLTSANRNLREDYLALLRPVQPLDFRIGSGREEPDGSVSFLVRFTGREQSITGEMYIRFVSDRAEQVIDDVEGVEISTQGNWRFEELILEGAKSREELEQELEQNSQRQRFDFLPYERFY